MLTSTPLLAQTNTAPDTGGTPIGNFEGFGGFQPSVDQQFADAPSQLTALISGLIGFLTILASLLFILYFLTGAIQWITSGADKQKLETARDKIVTAIIGLAITVASYAIIGLIGSIFGLDILNPSVLLLELTN